MEELRVLIEATIPKNGEFPSAWFDLPIDETEFEELLGVEADSEDYRIVEKANSQEFADLFNSFNEMAEQLDELIQKEFQQTLLLEKAQLKQLQAQINPHFLYNSFFTLNQMIARDMKEPAKELSRELGVYFRFLTRNTSDEVPLSDEYEHARVYADIQGFRFDGRIKVEMDELDQQLAQITVPRLILQLMIKIVRHFIMA